MIRKRIPDRDDKSIVLLIDKLLLPFTRKTTPDAKIDLKSLRNRLKGAVTFVVRAPGARPIGFISLVRKDRVLFVVMLAVDPRFQKRGLGSMFMEKAERTAQTLGCSELALWVDESNLHAQRFYGAKGFRAVYYEPQIKCYLLSKML